MGHIISTKKRKKEKEKNQPNLLINQPQSINLNLQCAIADLIDKDTTVLKFYNEITNNETSTYYDLNQRTSCNNWSYLHLACDAGNIAITKALLYTGAFVNSMIVDYTSPLDLALAHDNLELIQLLIENGGITLWGVSNYLNNSVERLKNLENDNISQFKKQKICAVKEYLLKNSIKDFGNHYHNLRFIVEAVKNGNVVEVKDILEKFKIDVTGFCHTSLIPIAIRNGDLEMVKLLEKHGALINEPILGHKYTPHYARNLGHNDIADFLEETQKVRYQRLKLVANSKKYQLFLLGLFADKNSTLHTRLGNDVGREIVKTAIALEYK